MHGPCAGSYRSGVGRQLHGGGHAHCFLAALPLVAQVPQIALRLPGLLYGK